MGPTLRKIVRILKMSQPLYPKIILPRSSFKILQGSGKKNSLSMMFIAILLRILENEKQVQIKTGE